MTLDEAAKYLADKHNQEFRIWKYRLIFSNSNGYISEHPTIDEVEAWLESMDSRSNRKPVTIRFDEDLHDKLQERFRGEYGKLSDFVNEVVRASL